ncbi:MAG: hypothetical protein ACYTF2_13430 [Planctomycetota bacterium]|jgi:hypothetical protein
MNYRFILRRALLGLGAVLLIAGWGCTRYADSQQQAVASGKSEPLGVWQGERVKTSTWVGQQEFVPGKTLYRAGILCMGLGAAVVVMAFPRGSWQAHAGP